MQRTSGHRPKPVGQILALSVLAASLLLGPSVAQALWTEPTGGTFAPAGNLAAPISTGASAQTKSGNFTVTGGVSAQTGATSSAGGVVGTLTGMGGTAVANSTAAGVRGEPTATTSTGGLQPGVYGLAGSNQNQTVGVYGSNGGFANAWAARFTGPTGADSTVNVYGPLTVAGSGNIGSPTYNSYFDPPSASRGPTVTVSTSSRAGAVAILGQLSSSITQGNAVEGITNPTVAGNCTDYFAPCAGILGTTNSTEFNALYTDPTALESGRFAGYFRNALAVTGALSDSAGPFPRTYADDRAASFIHPPQFAHLPPGSLLGVFNVGSSSTKQLVVDNEGLWIGARKRIRRSDGKVLVDAAASGPADGALAYDGTNLWLADRSASPNSMRRISVSDGSDFQTLSLGTRTFPTNQVMFYDGTSIWALTCASNALQLTEFIRYNASGAPVMGIGRTTTLVSPSSCTEQGAVFGMDRFGTRYLIVEFTPNHIDRFRYTAASNPVLEEDLQIAPNLWDFTTLFAHGGPMVTADGDEVFFAAINHTDHTLEIDRTNPVNLGTVNGVSGNLLNNVDWLATDGINISGVDSSVSPGVVNINGLVVTLPSPAGTNAGQIVFDGTNFWVAGINGDTNVYKLLR